MIYQPRSIQPTYKSIDGNEVGEISMVMNTTNYVSSYKITIFDMDNNVVYEGNKTDFPDGLYNGDTGFINLPTSIGLQNGTDYKWTARLYQPTQDMLITYGNVVEPTTYVGTVGNTGLPIGNYYCTVDNKDYLFITIKDLVEGDTLSFDSSSSVVEQRQTAKDSSIMLQTVEINSDNFQTLTMTAGGGVYTYTVGNTILPAGDYRFIISGVSYWFTTLSELDEGDKITYNPTTGKITQTKNVSDTDVTTPITNFTYGSYINLTKSYNTNTKVYLKQNINIKDGMILKINDESQEIYSYDVNTGLAIVNSPFSSVPTSEDKYNIYSDFIELTPENMLYVRALPSVSIASFENPLSSKEYTFRGVYSQSDNVPLVYYKWDLYAVTNSGQSLIKTTGKVYSANIQFYYDGFKSGETYNLVLTCENEFGIEAKTQTNMSVYYDVLTYEEQPVAEQTDEEGIRISWMTATSTEPYSIYTKNAYGYIQSSNNSSTEIWLERGQNIYPGQKVLIGASEMEGIVSSYDINTGRTILSVGLSRIPTFGEYYYILSEPDYNLTGINFLEDTPYMGVNSAELGDNHLVYEKSSGFAPFPEEYFLTTQFLLDDKFFYGDNNTFNDMALIARYEGNDLNGTEDLMLVARNYYFSAIIPSKDNDSLVIGTITGVEEDGSAIYISGVDINPEIQKYLCLIETSYIEYIQEYDAENHKIVLGKSLPIEERPSVGSNFFLYDTIESLYYEGANNVFCIQNTNIINPYSDYIWTDSGLWNDDYYWVEGGTPIGRAANTWWKVKATPTGMMIQKGGV